MAFLAGLKRARELQNAGDSSAALEECKALKASAELEKQNTQALLPFFMLMGLSAQGAEEWETGAEAFRKAASIQPDAPQPWKGLLACQEGAGGKPNLTEPLSKLIGITESKGNYTRSRGLRLRLAQELDDNGDTSRALATLQDFFDIGEAASLEGEAGLDMLLLAGILESRIENAKVQALAKKRMAKDGELSLQEALQASWLKLIGGREKPSNSLRDEILGRLEHKPSASPILLGRFITGLVEHYTAAAINGQGNAAKEKGWEDLSELCRKLRTLLSPTEANLTPLDCGLLQASWYIALPIDEEERLAKQAAEAMEAVVPPAGSGSSSEHLKAEAALYLADRTRLDYAGGAVHAQRLLQLVGVFKPFYDRELGDWRSICTWCLCQAALGYPSQDLAGTLLSAEDAMRRMEEHGKPLKDRTTDLLLVKGTIMSRLGRRVEAIELLEAHLAGAVGLEKEPTCNLLCTLASLLEDEGVAQAHLENAHELLPGNERVIGQLGWLHFQAGRVLQAEPLLQQALELAPKSAEAAFRLGRCYWELGGSKRSDKSTGCFALLLQSAKADPSHAQTFSWLGNWYIHEGGDVARGHGCYARALKLDANDSVAGKALAKGYLESGRSDQAVLLFKACAERGGGAFWAWRGLARTCMAEGQLNEAASHLQQAIKCLPKGWSSWADLGWVYHRQSKQQAALKAYTRALELLEGEQGELRGIAMVRTEIGIAQREVGLVDEAVENLVQAMEEGGTSFTLGAAGEAFLTQAHMRAGECLYSAATVCLQEGVSVMLKLLSLNQSGLIHHHKILGDLYTYASGLPPSCYGSVDDQAAYVEKGWSSYQAALNASTTPMERSRSHFDLGLNAYVRARMRQQALGDGSGLWSYQAFDTDPEVVELIGLARSSFRASISCDPVYSDAWNALGVVDSDPLVQQHCLARAIQLDRSPNAWANLAVLFIVHGLEDKAYGVLEELQAVVDHPVMWIGLGLLKEAQGGGTMIRQARDAYYAALETVQLLEGLIALGHTTTAASSTLQDGVVALQQYTELNPGNVCAWNRQGLLREHMDQLSGAVACYRQGISQLESQVAKLGGSEGSTRALHVIQANLARALTALGGGHEALELLGEEGSCSDELARERAQLACGNYDEVTDSLEKKANITMASRTLLLTALIGRQDYANAAAQGRTLSDEAEAVGDLKTQLRSVAVGAVAQDTQLAKQACKRARVCAGADIRSYYSSQLLAQSAVGAPTAAKHHTCCKVVHQFPDSSQAWSTLAALLLDEPAEEYSGCALIAASAAEDLIRRCHERGSLSTPSAADMAFSSALKASAMAEAEAQDAQVSRQAAKAFHLCPTELHARQLLAL
ncbi:unnamed protein product [Chrysoparadoxa australica]